MAPNKKSIHNYIATALVITAACVLVYRLWKCVRRIIMLRIPKQENKREINTDNGILRGVVSAVGSASAPSKGKDMGGR